MGIGVWFWVLMLLALLWGGFDIYRSSDPGWRVSVNRLLTFLLVFLLGLAQFGSPIKF